MPALVLQPGEVEEPPVSGWFSEGDWEVVAIRSPTPRLQGDTVEVSDSVLGFLCFFGDGDLKATPSKNFLGTISFGIGFLGLLRNCSLILGSSVGVFCFTGLLVP